MKSKLSIAALACVAIVPSAFATDPTFSDVSTAANSAVTSFLSTNAPALFAMLMVIIGFGLLVKWVKKIKSA